MPRIGVGDQVPKPFGYLKLSPEEKQFSQNPSANGVFVYWDIKHCPLPEDYNIIYLTAFINRALHKLDANEKLVVQKVTFVGDPSLVTEKQFQAIVDVRRTMPWKMAYERDPVCNNCENEPNYKYQGKLGESPDAVMLRELIGHAYDFGAPGYVMVITADFNFRSALTFLTTRGFKVLLAHHPRSHDKFHTFAYYTWLFPELIHGLGPTYKRDGKLADDFKAITLDEDEILTELISPKASDRNSKVHGLWDVENTPLPNGYVAEELIHKINVSLSKFNNRNNVLKLSKLTIVGSDNPSNGLRESVRNILRSSGEKLDCDVYCATPDQRYRRCSLCRREYNFPNPPQPYQDEFMRVMDVSDFLLTEKLMEHLVDFRAPGFVLLISKDADFGPTLEFLRRRGFKILLAQPGFGSSSLNIQAHIIWKIEDMLEGEGPIWFNNEFPKHMRR